MHRMFRFDADAEERTQRLMEKVNLFKVGDLVREALRLYEWAVDEREAGKRIASIDAAGNATTVDF
jgi:hypothetical protein